MERSKSLLSKVRRPILVGGTSAVGSIKGLASPMPGGTFVGGALGTMAGDKMADIAESMSGEKQPETIGQQLKNLPKEALEAAKIEAKGLVTGKVLSGVVGKVVSPLSKETASTNLTYGLN